MCYLPFKRARSGFHETELLGLVADESQEGFPHQHAPGNTWLLNQGEGYTYLHTRCFRGAGLESCKHGFASSTPFSRLLGRATLRLGPSEGLQAGNASLGPKCSLVWLLTYF